MGPLVKMTCTLAMALGLAACGGGGRGSAPLPPQPGIYVGTAADGEVVCLVLTADGTMWGSQAGSPDGPPVAFRVPYTVEGAVARAEVSNPVYLAGGNPAIPFQVEARAGGDQLFVSLAVQIPGSDPVVDSLTLQRAPAGNLTLAQAGGTSPLLATVAVDGALQAQALTFTVDPATGAVQGTVAARQTADAPSVLSGTFQARTDFAAFDITLQVQGAGSGSGSLLDGVQIQGMLLHTGNGVLGIAFPTGSGQPYPLILLNHQGNLPGVPSVP